MVFIGLLFPFFLSFTCDGVRVYMREKSRQEPGVCSDVTSNYRINFKCVFVINQFTDTNILPQYAVVECNVDCILV